MSTLLVMAESDFFISLYRVVETNRLFLQTHLDDLLLKERFDMVNYRNKLLKEKNFGQPQPTGFSGYPVISYLRKIDQQQVQRSRLLSHMYFYTFEHLQVDQSIYSKKLDEEMQVLHHKQKLSKSPHKGDRDQASKITNRFLREHEEIQTKQRLDLNQLIKITPIKLTTLKKYLARLQELKREAFKNITTTAEKDKSSKSLPESAFEFLENRGPNPTDA